MDDLLEQMKSVETASVASVQRTSENSGRAAAEAEAARVQANQADARSFKLRQLMDTNTALADSLRNTNQIADALKTNPTFAKLVADAVALKFEVKTFPSESGLYSPTENNQNIASDTDFNVCAVSYISVSEGGGGQCGVKKIDRYWSLQVSGQHYCCITCLKYSLTTK
jgi:hypothetical protein